MMRGMVRKQLYIEAEQDRLLKARARSLGVTEAEVVRRALDGFLAGPSDSSRADRAWAALMRSGERRAVTTPASPRAWTRDDIHDR